MKTHAVLISFAFFLAPTLSIARPMHAQTTYFKVGDSVEAMSPGGKWESAVVTEECDRSNGCYGYKVAHGSDGWFVKSAYIRAHSLTPAEQAEAAQGLRHNGIADSLWIRRGDHGF